jgi:hypothetical protein
MSHEKLVSLDDTNGEIPPWLKWTLTAINRVGFPVVAFGAMTYLCFVTLKEQSKSINQLNETLIKMTASLDNNSESVKRMVEAIYRTRTTR